LPGGASSLGIDHFLCYDAKRSGDTPYLDPLMVTLVDQFGETDRLLTKPKQLCTSVDKNYEGILDEEASLTCYEVKSLEQADPIRDLKLDVLVTNQFGYDQAYEVKKTKTVCLPSTEPPLECDPEIEICWTPPTPTVSGAQYSHAISATDPDANIVGRVNFATAEAACENLEEGGNSDWRLPTIAELQADCSLLEDFPIVWHSPQIWSSSVPPYALDAHFVLQVDACVSIAFGGPTNDAEYVCAR
jgi:hypothetical protein